MSEHRSPRRPPAIIRLPRPDDEDEGWPPWLFEQFRTHAEVVNDDLDRWGRRMPLSVLLDILPDCYERLALDWAGLPPRKADELAQRLAPWWAKLNAVMAANRERAKAMVAKRWECRQKADQGLLNRKVGK